MNRNAQIHLWIESELKESLEKEANEENVSLNELCLQKLRNNSRMVRMELMLEMLIKKLNVGRHKMGNKEERAKEFIKCLGKGKSIYECESENDAIDEELEDSEE